MSQATIPATRSAAANLERAQVVIDHARHKRRRGRGPSMSFMGEYNPRKALALAERFTRSEVLNSSACQKQAALYARLTGLAARAVPHLTSGKRWVKMNEAERKMTIIGIVADVGTEAELRERLAVVGVDVTDDLYISWHVSEPGNVVGHEARLLTQALGGLVSKSGALVSIMIDGEDF